MILQIRAWTAKSAMVTGLRSLLVRVSPPVSSFWMVAAMAMAIADRLQADLFFLFQHEGSFLIVCARTAGCLTAVEIVLEAGDVVLAQVGPGLHLDEYQLFAGRGSPCGACFFPG